MFKTCPNHLDVNNFLKTFENNFDFIHFEENVKQDRRGVVLQTLYNAKTKPEQRDIRVSFIAPYKTTLCVKHFVAKVSFIDPTIKPMDIDKVRNDHTTLAHQLESMYSPNFDKVNEIIKLFVDEGTKAGIINIVDKRYYQKSLKTHLTDNSYDVCIHTTDKNVADIYFNQLLQKGEYYNNVKTFKKSYVNVDFVYLVHSDNTMHPYFKIRLPYFEDKKASCMLSMKGDKVYLYLDDKQLHNAAIDLKTPVACDTDNLRDVFTKLFENQMKKTIATRLKISKTDLKDLSINELKEYFVIIEMINI